VLIERKRAKKKNLLKNIIIFIFSLIIASALWFYAVTNLVIEKEIELPVRVIPPKHFCVLSYSPEKLTFLVRAKTRQFLFLRGVKPSILVKNPQIGKVTVPLDYGHIKFPYLLGITNYSIRGRDNLECSIDSFVVRRVKVILTEGLEASPESVNVYGPKGLIGSLESIIPDSIPQNSNFTSITMGTRLIKVKPRIIRIKR